MDTGWEEFWILYLSLSQWNNEIWYEILLIEPVRTLVDSIEIVLPSTILEISTVTTSDCISPNDEFNDYKWMLVNKYESKK